MSRMQTSRILRLLSTDSQQRFILAYQVPPFSQHKRGLRIEGSRDVQKGSVQYEPIYSRFALDARMRQSYVSSGTNTNRLRQQSLVPLSVEHRQVHIARLLKKVQVLQSTSETKILNLVFNKFI